MSVYELVQSVQLDERGNRIECFGIRLGDRVLGDVSPDRERLSRLVQAMNELKLDPVHFRDVVSDFLCTRQSRC